MITGHTSRCLVKFDIVELPELTAAKGLGQRALFLKGGMFAGLEDQKSWYGWHHYKNKVAVAVKRDDWVDFFHWLNIFVRIARY